MLDGMSDSIQGSRIENLHSREVDRQSPTARIFWTIFWLCNARSAGFYLSSMTGHYNILSYHIIWWSWFATIWAGKVNGRPKGFTLHRLENGREFFAVFDNMSSWKRIRCSFRQPYPRQCLCTFIFFLFKLFSELSRIALFPCLSSWAWPA